MKKSLILFSIFSFMILSVISCKDDDPTDNKLFTGIYKGKISYKEKDKEPVNVDNGTITVVKVGSKYTFKFSNDIPPINSIEIQEGDNKFDEKWSTSSFVKIDNKILKMNMEKGDAIWEADCKR